MSQKKLYRITFSFEDNKIEQNFYPNVYSSSVPEVQAIFDAMALVRTAKTISIFQWMYEDLPANLQYLYTAQRDYWSRLGEYLHKQKKGMAAYVQWGKIIIPDFETAFDPLRTVHIYRDYNLIVSNAVAREKLKELRIIKDIRDHRVKMTITQAGPENSYYVTFLQFHEFVEAKKIIIGAGKGLVTWEPATIVKSQSELAVGERPARDTPHGWQAWVITDSTLQHGADIMVFMRRPQNPYNKYHSKPMPEPAKEGEKLQSELIYYKIHEEVATVKNLINGLNKLRPGESKGNAIAQVKRAILCGRDQTQYRMIDIFEGLSDTDMSDFKWNLTPSQNEFIYSYCRKILNGIGILQGPAGSGKTTIIKVLLEIAIKRGLKIAIVTESNSAADNVIEVIADKAFIAVRLHSLGKNPLALLTTLVPDLRRSLINEVLDHMANSSADLERRHLLKHARKEAKLPLRPADPEPDTEPKVGEEDGPTIDAKSDHGDNGAEEIITGPLGHTDGDEEDDNEETGKAKTISAPPSDKDGDEEDDSKEPDGPSSKDDAEEEIDDADAWKDDELTILFSDLMLKSAQAKYENAKKIMSPDDPVRGGVI